MDCELYADLQLNLVVVLVARDGFPEEYSHGMAADYATLYVDSECETRIERQENALCIIPIGGQRRCFALGENNAREIYDSLPRGSGRLDLLRAVVNAYHSTDKEELDEYVAHLRRSAPPP